MVDDEQLSLDIVSSYLEMADFIVSTSNNSEEALISLKKDSYDLVITDYCMPDMSGLELTRKIKESRNDIEIIVMTGVPEKLAINEFRKMGIVFFLFKPILESNLIYTVHAALYHTRIRKQLLLESFKQTSDTDILGISEFSRNIRNEIKTFALSDIPLLIIGETGTGKEIIARNIHEMSLRSKAPLIPVNCGTLGSLADSELFGHVKGAFTGAVKSTKGFIGAAHEGTLFLDEIGDLPQATQVKLLRFLDSGEYTQVGSSEICKADIRIICATNKDLKEGVKQNWFREDLYYRLAGVLIQTLPLRFHIEDIPLLVWDCISKLGIKNNCTYRISDKAIEALTKYPWPGNVRQLKQVIQVLIKRCENRVISETDVIHEMGAYSTDEILKYQDAKKIIISEFDKSYFSKLLASCESSINKAMEISGMHKKNLYDKLKECNLPSKIVTPSGEISKEKQ
ncbi:MAG: hypothetical protein ACD_79C01240G0004 [uncultured bacterium]|nr:MAG: hypothetical protein ACD_79C01240G0004 [uncultured bacterium]